MEVVGSGRLPALWRSVGQSSGGHGVSVLAPAEPGCHHPWTPVLSKAEACLMSSTLSASALIKAGLFQSQRPSAAGAAGAEKQRAVKS